LYFSVNWLYKDLREPFNIYFIEPVKSNLLLLFLTDNSSFTAYSWTPS